jgi:hypothetical protein
MFIACATTVDDGSARSAMSCAKLKAIICGDANIPIVFNPALKCFQPGWHSF